jgi:hypothetical protein
MAGWAARIGLGAAPGRAAWSALFASLAALALYSRFQHWAGDGSFGPRYLIPILPLLFVAVAFALEPAGRAWRAVAVGLALIGVVVQIGGVAIYFGAQMREAGDYPYTRALEDPRHMSDSHFNPSFTPIVSHWRMLIRNAGEHLAGRAPRIGVSGAGADASTSRVAATDLDGDRAASTAPGTTGIDSAAPSARAGSETQAHDRRVVVSPEEQRALLHALDFWWLYLGYAGLPRAPVWAALVLLLVLAVFAAGRARESWRAEARG